MEVVNANASVLSNYEVLEELKKYRNAKKGSGLRNLATITYETLQSLETTPAQHQTAENILSFIRASKQFNLTREEILMMVNDPPTGKLQKMQPIPGKRLIRSFFSAAIHITVLIQFSEERLTEDQINEIISLSKKFLLPTEPEVNGT